MKKSWGLIPKILDGRKTIESRWGKNKSAPWHKVKVGETVYFKNAGEPVTVATKVKKVIEFERLNSRKVKEILQKYGGEDGIAVSDIKKTFDWAREKRYCTLVYIEKAKRVRPFAIDKSGFGIGAAWISVPKIKDIKQAS